MIRQAGIMKRQTEIIDGSLKVAKDSLTELRTYVTLTDSIATSGEKSANAVVASNVLSRVECDHKRAAQAGNALERNLEWMPAQLTKRAPSAETVRRALWVAKTAS
jgi:hypothetical protein